MGLTCILCENEWECKCIICDEPYCDRCKINCESCYEFVCESHLTTCKKCGDNFCDPCLSDGIHDCENKKSCGICYKTCSIDESDKCRICDHAICKKCYSDWNLCMNCFIFKVNKHELNKEMDRTPTIKHLKSMEQLQPIMVPVVLPGTLSVTFPVKENKRFSLNKIKTFFKK